jgi:hypothetical protein
MIAVLALFDPAPIAKLASAFQLLLFGLVCIAVIVMREAKIPTYKPGFKAPFYPWLQVMGILISFWLIIEMGILAIAFTGMVTIACVLWYHFYASGNLERRGAIFHIHQRLGQQRYEGLERELMTIIHDRTQAENLSYEALVARSVMMDFRYGIYDTTHLTEILTEEGASKLNIEPQVIIDMMSDEVLHLHPISERVHIHYATHIGLTQPELFVLRFGPQAKIGISAAASAHTLMFLVVPPKPVGLDLRLAGHLAEVAQSEHFETRWLAAATERDMNEVLMRDDHFLHGPLKAYPKLYEQAGQKISDVNLPASCLIAMIERDGKILVATPDTQLLATDEVAIIGEPVDLQALREGTDDMGES